MLAGCGLLALLLIDVLLGVAALVIGSSLLMALFVLFLLLQLVLGAMIWVVYGGLSILRDVRDLNRHVSLMEVALACVLGPVFGLAFNVYSGPVDPKLAFYETAAQVAVTILVASALETGLRTRTADPAEQRAARGISLGIALSIAIAVTASLVAIARDDGSAVLFGLTAGGLYFGLIFLLAAAGRGWRDAEG
jgi:cation transport ATPase